MSGDARTHTVTVPQLAWWGDVETPLTFPKQFDVKVYRMQGADAPPLSVEEIKQAITRPIASPPLRELARGKKNAVIIFDDMSRPTKVSEIAPLVVEELIAGGLNPNRIEFICALGGHGAHTAQDFRKKLGPRIVAEFNVYNHNPYDNCTSVGTTTLGTLVSLNTEFVNADLKIGIGAIIPHPMSGFGGGPKIVLPGIASVDTIVHNHRLVRESYARLGIKRGVCSGLTENNLVLQDMEEACKISGLDFKIDVLVNLRRDTVAVFAGKPPEQFHEGIKVAKWHYLTQPIEAPDIVVINCNAKINETSIAYQLGLSLIPESGATLVLLSNNPGGEVTHYLMRQFGETIGGPLWRRPKLPSSVRKFILMTPYKERSCADWLAPVEAITWTTNWEQVVAVLSEEYPTGARVAVVPDATLQYFPAG